MLRTSITLLGVYGISILAAVSSASILQDLTEVLESSEQTTHCAVPAELKLLSCVDSDGQAWEPAALENGSVPVNNLCDSDQGLGFLCLPTGISLQLTPYEIGSLQGPSHGLLAREKRGFWSGFGAVVGSFFGPGGAAIGWVVGTAIDCRITCGKEGQVSGPPPPPPNSPPNITCPTLKQKSPVVAAPGQSKAVVQWTEAKASDKEDGDITKSVISDEDPGKFANGHHVVLFRAVDSRGSLDFCKLSFDVEVIKCNRPDWPMNGRLHCPVQQYVYGSSCTVTCQAGYRVTPGTSTTIHCDKSGNWDNIVPDCEPTRCQKAPTISKGSIVCPNQPVFGHLCVVSCDDGYRVKGPGFLQCDRNGRWGQAPSCEDKTPPRFTFCPPSKQVNIDAANNTAKVTWQEPDVTDNSGTRIILVEVNGNKPGARFAAGTHMIRYTVEDSSGNRGNDCVFMVEVKSISCEPPKLDYTGTENLKYNCPVNNHYSLGTECQLSCSSGYPLEGPTSIRCLSDSTANPPKPRWQWDSHGLDPYCKETACPNLAAPAHGALSCSKWSNGDMCQLQCQSGFDVPLLKDGMYVCGQSNGKWRPDNRVPACNPQRHARGMHLPSELYYYTGKCNSSVSNLHQIQENFVQALNASKYFEKCRGHSECRAEFVDVTCGPTARRKRDTRHDVIRRAASPFAYVVEFKFVIPYNLNGKSPDDAFVYYDDILNDLVDVVDEEVKHGAFDLGVGDLHTERDSFAPGMSELTCPDGTQQKPDTGTCAGCPTGRYFSNSSLDCQYCPVGFYQDEAYHLDCKACPKETSTLETGSVSATQCLDICKPGTYSLTGLSPCAPCQSGFYQNMKGQTSCLPCNPGTTSEDEGSLTSNDCKEYDVQVADQQPIRLMHENSTIADVTMATWVRPQAAAGSQTMFEIQDANKISMVSLSDFKDLTIEVSGTPTKTGKALPVKKWSHVALTVSATAGEIILMLNGVKVHSYSQYSSSRGGVLIPGDSIRIEGELLLSSFTIHAKRSTAAEISTLTQSCRGSSSPGLYTMEDLGRLAETKISVPSQCDAVDDCASSPCGNHECEDKPGDYVCHCQGGYTGRQCQTPPDFCLNHACQHGATCRPGMGGNYTCHCSQRYHGQFCQTQVVDGAWSPWSDWTACSQSCGGGARSRTRVCDNPPPDPKGQTCPGDARMTETCNDGKCPVCPRLRNSFGAHLSCNETTGLKRCTLQCRPGLYFATQPLEYYECGALTGYKWNHQTPDNPRGTLPTCSVVKPPKAMTVDLEGQYASVTCSPEHAAAIIASMQNKVNTLPCVKAGSCSATLSSRDCTFLPETKVRRSAAHHVTLDIALTSAMGGETLDLDKFFDTKSATPGLLDLVKKVRELELASQLVFNNSATFFQVTVDGRPHTINSTALNVRTSSVCPEGTVWRDLLCVLTPPGSRADGSYAELCGKGFYQDEAGQATCKSCPSGQITDGVGSTALKDCIGEKTKVTGPGESHISILMNIPKPESGGDSSKTGLVIGLSVSLVALLLLAVGAVAYYKLVFKRKRRVEESYVDLKMFPQATPSKPTFMR